MKRVCFGALLLVIATACPKPETNQPTQTTATETTATTTAANLQPPDCSLGSGCTGSACLTSITSAAATFPTVACPLHGESQGGVDIFSWNEFIALNWPAANNCTADTGKSILNITGGSTQGPVVWQTLMSSDDVFVAPGTNPAQWCQGNSLAALFKNLPHVMRHVAKADPAAHKLGGMFAAIAEPTGVEAVGGVVTDQSGRWLRYEKYMNQSEYQEIVKNSWYRLAVLDSIPSLNLPDGSVEIKAAWKILTQQEIAGNRYYTTVATVYNTPQGAPSPGPNPVTLGLVGLHIIQKTPQQSGFFWSTFEQVDNDKVFYNPSSNTAANTQTAKQPYMELDPDGKPHNIAVQIKRVNNIQASPALNAYYQGLLGNSVFKYYQLISTQWQTGGAPQGTPANVANEVIETYVQSVSAPFRPNQPKSPQVTGCLTCHLDAKAANKKTTTDHSFLFLEAK
ncbi:MAG TPA: hypothetical protein VJ901_08660 [Thermoanaerobaculia bacterium]|nr:hypothetical protein [Thermoanaerobaculia bacterium]